ncbi:MAG: hypothetical protein A4E30_00703 [Methanomassiliicoccales archaeon PtaB.Bin215]|nr:MAG: hypothetical protein A4E30_00703 [Methanomassiliicoccales archaeon PtaB.Bin215]
MKDRLTVRSGGITTLVSALFMVGSRSSCQGCGAPLRKGYEYCNLCGRKASVAPEDRATIKVGPPKVLPGPDVKRQEGPKTSDNKIPRRELVIALLAMTCMAPFCTWLSSLGGVIGISAAFNDAFYGRYVVLLAAVGLLTIMAGDLVPAKIPRKVIITGVGVGTLLLTALDYVEIMRYNMGPESYFITAMPGIGIYLALALGTALTMAVLAPNRRAKAQVTDRPVLRPGSPGSGPSARR